MESKPALVEELEKVGALVLFGVKFHPELMPIILATGRSDTI